MIRGSREVGAALGALFAYATTVLPPLRRELRRWRGEAETLADPARRAQALAALRDKGSNVEAVAVFAVTAPRRRRAPVVRAIAALQVAIDYLDSVEEEGIGAAPDDDRYLSRLLAASRLEVAALPAGSLVLPSLDRAIRRCRDGQRQTHAAAGGDHTALARWAEGLPQPPGYRWWELAAGASSSVAAHALIAAAADPRTDVGAAAAIDAAYCPSIGALTVLLDDLVDRDADLAAGEHNYLGYYRDTEEAAERIAAIGREATTAVRALPRRRRHAAILAGVAAFYLSAPETQTAYAAPIRQRLLEALGPGTKPLAAFMRLRRLP